MNYYQGINYSNILGKKFLETSTDEHSMGLSLEKYIGIKLQESILEKAIKTIEIVGNYERKGSLKEKKDKLFNYKRPSVIINKCIATINCYPGIDYVFHYASLIKTYLNIMGLKKEVVVHFPTCEEIKKSLLKSNIKQIPKCKTAILGYVQGFEYLSVENKWHGKGDFQWKKITKEKILVGCKHSYWGDIAGYIVKILAQKGVKRIIYVGKLGTLDGNVIPNETIATGNKSYFIDGSYIEWKNIFDKVECDYIKKGVHYTLPSVIQETKKWVLKNKKNIKFVDPEIGHMAKAAAQSNIEFSYLHIVSDNLVKKFDEDLSNERKEEILKKRKKLIDVIGAILSDV